MRGIVDMNHFKDKVNEGSEENETRNESINEREGVMVDKFKSTLESPVESLHFLA